MLSQYLPQIEPDVGFEPTTYALQERRSTPNELIRQVVPLSKPNGFLKATCTPMDLNLGLPANQAGRTCLY